MQEVHAHSEASLVYLDNKMKGNTGYMDSSVVERVTSDADALDAT